MIARVKLENGSSVLQPKSGTSSFPVDLRIQSSYLFPEAKQPLQPGQMLGKGEESRICWLGLWSAGMQPGTHPGREPGSPRDPTAPAGEDPRHPQIPARACVPARGGGRRMRSPAPGGPVPRNAGFALGNPLPSRRDKGREQRKNNFPKSYLFWHAWQLSARFSPRADGSRAV